MQDPISTPISIVKIARNGKASALTDQQFQDLLNAAPSPKYRMLWALQRYTAARIGEALQVTWAATAGGRVTFLKATTKSKRTRQVSICPALAAEIDRYRATCLDVQPGHFLFHTDDSVTQPMSRQAADKQLRKTAALIGVEGISTHSFRRTAAQAAVDKGAPLRHVMALTGHKSLGSLGEYLDASDSDVLACLA